ncbi:DNA-binding response regulator, NarL/FixJ family, contains REC and HTH domains [Rhodoferax sp. OV413]|uniref:response regulator n=1 Tax=Rhodoferax sp. OV413 TaxID=1855285 RepID=UPI0008921756|nr:response regulator transcription factor [Rhodoferax sp. OV413]SDP12992.1 DNA-binding response regulator, NarL/FixJ family, contains REC and HTH domains [Rhodoferax sp. OV413]
MPTPVSIRLLIVDDHPIVRQSLNALLGAFGAPMQVVATAGSAEEALVLAEQQQPDIVLTDLQMKPTSGIQLIQQLSQRQPAIRYVVFTASTQDEHMLQAFDAGAQGYVLKESEAGELVQAIEAVMGGATHYPAGLKRALDRRQQQPALTARETEVLALVAQGLTSKAIARALDIDSRTVDAHRANIRQRFGLDSSAALLRFAMENCGGKP